MILHIVQHALIENCLNQFFFPISSIIAQINSFILFHPWSCMFNSFDLFQLDCVNKHFRCKFVYRLNLISLLSDFIFSINILILYDPYFIYFLTNFQLIKHPNFALQLIIWHQTLFFPHWDDHCYLNSTVGVMNLTIDFLDQVISLKFNIDSCQTNQNGLQLTISLRVEEWLTLKNLQGTPK